MAFLLLFVSILLFAPVKTEDNILSRWQEDYKECSEKNDQLEVDLKACNENKKTLEKLEMCNSSEKAEILKELNKTEHLLDLEQKANRILEQGNEILKKDLSVVTQSEAKLNESLMESSLAIERLESKVEKLDLTSETQQNRISELNGVIHYLEDYILEANLSTGHHTLSDATFRNPKLLYNWGVDNPLAASLYLFSWTIVLVLLVKDAVKCCVKKAKKRKLRKKFLPELKKVTRNAGSPQASVTFDNQKSKAKITKPTRPAPPPPNSPESMKNRPLPDVPETTLETHMEELKDKIATFPKEG